MSKVVLAAVIVVLAGCAGMDTTGSSGTGNTGSHASGQDNLYKQGSGR